MKRVYLGEERAWKEGRGRQAEPVRAENRKGERQARNAQKQRGRLSGVSSSPLISLQHLAAAGSVCRW